MTKNSEVRYTFLNVPNDKLRISSSSSYSLEGDGESADSTADGAYGNDEFKTVGDGMYSSKDDGAITLGDGEPHTRSDVLEPVAASASQTVQFVHF